MPSEKIREITVADLPDQLGSTSNKAFLLCEHCWSQSSAHSGDYWDLPKDHVFTCCKKPMRLVRKEVRFVDVKLKPRKKP